jgi:hypothetical protein
MMSGFRLRRAASLLGIGVLIGLAVSNRPIAVPRVLNDAAAQLDERRGPTDLASLRADTEVLKQKATDQAHVMVSVAYHFNNLWFAGQHGNWPLAQFYWNEVRSHLRWAVRVIPVRKDDEGQDIQLGEILEAMENTPLARLLEAIEAKDRDKFVAAYRFSLETCYACHKASDKPYLRPQIPTHPAEPTINFDPEAMWPR